MLHLKVHLNVDFSPLEKLKCQLKTLKPMKQRTIPMHILILNKVHTGKFE